MSEAIYDKDVAPELARIAGLSRAAGMHFVAHVEYEPGAGAFTADIGADASFATRLVYWATKCDGNIDAMMLAVMKHARKHGHSSMILSMLKVPMAPEDKTNNRQET